MKAINPKNLLATACSGTMVVVAVLGMSSHAKAAVTVTNDWNILSSLEKPTGKFDEPGLSGFEYLISSRTNQYRENDQYLIAGEESLSSTSLVSDLGMVGELSGTALGFSIQHNLVGGRNFTFSIDDPSTASPSVLCWGANCAAGSNAAELLDGQAPITQYNGLQIQLRAQEVSGSSALLSGLTLTGVDFASGSPALLDGLVTPLTPSTVPFPLDLPGRLGQWVLGDSLDLVVNEWELSGMITLSRPDDALDDLTKVRLSVDLVNDTRLPLPNPIPVPAAAWLFGSALLGLAELKRRR